MTDDCMVGRVCYFWGVYHLATPISTCLLRVLKRQRYLEKQEEILQR